MSHCMSAPGRDPGVGGLGARSLRTGRRRGRAGAGLGRPKAGTSRGVWPVREPGAWAREKGDAEAHRTLFSVSWIIFAQKPCLGRSPERWPIRPRLGGAGRVSEGSVRGEVRLRAAWRRESGRAELEGKGRGPGRDSENHLLRCQSCGPRDRTIRAGDGVSSCPRDAAMSLH